MQSVPLLSSRPRVGVALCALLVAAGILFAAFPAVSGAATTGCGPPQGSPNCVTGVDFSATEGQGFTNKVVAHFVGVLGFCSATGASIDWGDGTSSPGTN